MAESHLFKNLRKVITLIDRLRDIGLQDYISLPRIVVLGTQSAGKSSLLEQIVGLDFLPRGSGVVTRRPLELRMVYKPPTEIKRPFAIFEELKNQTFEDFDKVRDTISILTDKVAGNNKNIVDIPIILTIYSSECPDLTLVDLPGITRIPIRGSGQGEDIEKVTKDMAKKYITDEQTIILCVIPANQDITTSDALLLARQIDPKGLRTLGVFTKIDIMDKGVNAKQLILGEEVPLKLGYVGVINRSQQDIIDNKPVKAHLKYEKEYFSSHPVYSALPSGTLGTESLTNRLTEVLYKHIRRYIPELSKQILGMVKLKQQRLNELGPSLPETDQEKMKFLWSTVTQFSIQFKTSIQGTYSKENTARNELPAGSEIRMILQELYKELVDKDICSEYTDEQINKAIMLHEGGAIPGFPSIDAFLALLVPKIKQMRDPAHEVINEVYLILERLAKTILDKICEKVPKIKDQLQEKIVFHIQNERDRTREIIDDLMDTEINYIYTADIEFIYERAAKQRDPKVKVIQGQSEGKKESPLIMELRKKIDDYFAVVLRGMRDTVPKQIGNFLVKGVQEKMRMVLFDITHNSKEFFGLIEEPHHIVSERHELRKAVDTLNNARDVIRKDPEMSTVLNQAEKEDEEETTKQGDLLRQREAEAKKKQQLQKEKDEKFMKAGGVEEEEEIKKVPSTDPKKTNSQNQGPANPEAKKEPAAGNLFGTKVAQPNTATNNNPNNPANNNNPNNNPAAQKNSMFGTGQPQPKPNQPQNQPPVNNSDDKRAQFQQQAQKTGSTSQNPPPQNQQQQQQNPASKVEPPKQQPPQQQQQPPANQQQQQQQKPVQNAQGQPATQPAKGGMNNLFGNAVDKGVDKVTGNPQFKDKVGQAAGQAAYTAVDSQVPIKGADGKNPIAEQAAKMAEKGAKEDAVQQQINQGMKDGIKQQAGVQPADDGKKKDGGGFKFW